MNILVIARPIPEIIESFRGDKLEISTYKSNVKKYLEGCILLIRSELLKKHKEIKRKITELTDRM